MSCLTVFVFLTPGRTPNQVVEFVNTITKHPRMRTLYTTMAPKQGRHRDLKYGGDGNQKPKADQKARKQGKAVKWIRSLLLS